MKNALMLPVVFCVTVLGWTFILGLFTVMDSAQVLTALLDGQYAEFFQALGFGILDLIPFTLSFSFLFLFFYLMRHRTSWFLSAPIVLVLAFVSIVVLIPLSWNFSSTLNQARRALDLSLSVRINRVLPPGIVRQGEDGTKAVWFRESDEGSTVYPVITQDGGSSVTTPALSVYDSCVYEPSSGSLVSNGRTIVPKAGEANSPLATLTQSIPFLGFFRSVTVPVLTGLREASYRGAWGYYIEAGSLFLAVLSLWAFSFSTGWRLLNLLSTLAAFGALYYLYPEFHSGQAWQRLSLFPWLAGRTDLIGPLCYAALSCLVLLFIGGPAALRRLRRRSAGGEHV